MMEKDNLGLSLSLSSSQTLHHQSLQLNLMPSILPSSSIARLQPPPCNDTFAATSSFDRSSIDTKSFLRGIDVNRLPATAECEEVAVSSPNSTLSSVSGKRSEREPNGEDHDNERASSRGGGASDEEDGDNSRKKLRLSKEQSATLEDSFKEHNTLNPKQKMALAKQLGLRPRQVEVWFQNRRARTKLKQTEVDCEFLKRCCENLTDENRRLQKEVQELRALKLSPQIYMQMAQPTTLTMCPSCERVTTPTQSVSLHPRPMPISPWGQPTGHMTHGSFSAIRPRS